MKVLFSITGTPKWANGGQTPNRPPYNYSLLRDFAYAAAARYSGQYVGEDGRTLPAVRLWAAWNEPNNPAFLRPQFVQRGSKWVIQSAISYAKICNAIYEGIHETLFKNERVACGVTAPRGNNNPNSARPSVSPVAFVTAAKKAGMKRFDAYAHNPYYGVPTETPTTKPPGTRSGQVPTSITLANLNVLIAAVSHLYGPRRFWITEYGYQTRPPDPAFGVSWSEPGALPDGGVRDRQAQPADRPDALVPRPRRAESRRLAVRADDRRRPQEARRSARSSTCPLDARSQNRFLAPAAPGRARPRRRSGG